MKALIVAIVMLFVTTNANAGNYYIPKIPPVVKSTMPFNHPNALWCTGGCVWVGGFIVAVTALIVVHEIREARKGCAKTNDEARFWRPLCNNVVSTRG